MLQKNYLIKKIYNTQDKKTNDTKSRFSNRNLTNGWSIFSNTFYCESILHRYNIFLRQFSTTYWQISPPNSDKRVASELIPVHLQKLTPILISFFFIMNFEAHRKESDDSCIIFCKDGRGAWEKLLLTYLDSRDCKSNIREDNGWQYSYKNFQH